MTIRNFSELIIFLVIFGCWYLSVGAVMALLYEPLIASKVWVPKRRTGAVWIAVESDSLRFQTDTPLLILLMWPKYVWRFMTAKTQ